MSSPFPQIRLHGDKAVAGQHVKRGMLELFKTEAYIQNAGVSTTRRTVPVDDYTTIEVRIAEGQTFINITSLPGGEGAPVEQPEEEEFDYTTCPSAFIIRKIDWDGHDEGVGPEVKGYLIAYNHTKNAWGVASFVDELGGTTPYGSNLGWWHAEPTSESGYYKCDVLTWHGASSPGFRPPYVNGAPPDGTSPRSYLSTKLYFRGRKFQAPGSIAGACILTENNVEYVYVHTVSLGTGGTSELEALMVSLEIISRISVSALLSGSTNWEQVKTIWSGTEMQTAWGGTYSGSFNRIGFRGCDHISKDGIATFVREHTYGPFVGDSSPQTGYGMSKVIEMDMRNGNWKIIHDAMEDGPSHTGGWAGDHTEMIIPGTTVTFPSHVGVCTETHTWTTAKPWIFHVAPGTGELYTYGLQVNGFIEKTYVGLKGGDPEDWQFWIDYDTTLNADLKVEVIVYKNHKEHERLMLGRVLSTVSAYEKWEGTTLAERACSNSESTIYTRNLFEHLPDIPNSWRYVEKRFEGSAGAGYASINLVEDGKKKELSGQSVGTDIWGYAGLQAWLPWTSGREPYDDGVFTTTKSYRFSSWNGGSNTTTRLVFFTATANPNRLPCRVYGFNNWYDTSDFFGVGLGFRYDRPSFDDWGDAASFMVRRKDTFYPWMAEAYAVHRKVRAKNGGEQVPYLWLRRPIYHGRDSGVNPDLLDIYIGSMSNLYLADTADFYSIPIPDPYGQDTTYSAVPIPHWRGRWNFWTPHAGYFQSTTEDPPGSGIYPYPNWNKSSGWTLKSNFLTKEQLNQLTKETDNAFFEIGVI